LTTKIDCIGNVLPVSTNKWTFEEAEFGYQAVEFGETGLETWLFWVDILQFLGEFESAIQTLLQACEYFPEAYEIEYRLADYTLC
jgi:hypothetical protein